MSKITVEYSIDRVSSPLSFWVHKALDSDVSWSDSTKYLPSLAPLVLGKGYPTFGLEYRGHFLYFCSKEEIVHCIDVLSHKVLPSPKRLTEIAGHSGYKHLHWLTKWPGDIKAWKDRQLIIKSLNKLLVKAT